MKRPYFIIPVILCILSSLAGTSAFAYQSPGEPTGYVNDFAGMLSQDEKVSVEATLKDFHDMQGGEISVVTIDTLGGDAIEDYANTLFREWGIGQKDKNNGVLLLIAKQEHGIRIEVGYGYEGVLTDARSSEIIRNVISPAFKQEAYGKGISDGVAEIITEINDPNAITASSGNNGEAGRTILKNWGIIFTFGFFALTWLASIFSRSKEWWLGGIVGGGLGVLISGVIGFIYSGLLVTLILVLIGLLFDFLVSREYKKSISNSSRPAWWSGGTWGGGGSSSGGGFGGFSGGSSGGGGASGSW